MCFIFVTLASDSNGNRLGNTIGFDPSSIGAAGWENAGYAGFKND